MLPTNRSRLTGGDITINVTFATSIPINCPTDRIRSAASSEENKMNESQRDNLSIECLRLIVLQDKDVIKKLRAYEKRIGVKMYIIPLCFRVPVKGEIFSDVFYPHRVYDIDRFDKEPLCDCMFEHEYLDYVQNGRCNEEMFTRICSNLENRRCEHVRGERSAQVGIYLIHAAVATNNTKVTKYISRQILKRSNECLDNLKTGFRSLTAAHTAVLKGSGDALQYVIGLYATKKKCNKWPYTFSFLFSDLDLFLHGGKISIDKRNVVTGNVETFRLKGRDVLIYLLANCKGSSEMKILFQFLPSFGQEKFEDLMHTYLLTRNEEMAHIVLSDRRTSNMHFDSKLLLNAVFLHAHDFIYSWIRQERRLSVDVMRREIHALFIAEALGCHECISLMLRGMQKNKTDRLELEHYTFEHADISPFIIACYSAEIFKYDSDILINILNTLYFNGSCDLNKRNSSYDTVIHVLLKSNFCTNEALECLLDLGCDVNELDLECRTPLHVLLKLSSYSVDTMKCLLKHGADINITNVLVQTPFSEIVKQVKQKLHWPFYTLMLDQSYDKSLECLKLMLYFNPRVDIHSEVLYQAKNIICNDVFKGYVNLPLVPLNKSDSVFAILMEMGFMNYVPDNVHLRNRYLLLARDTNTGTDGYYEQFICRPRSLQSICRVGIRQAFPGYQLHRLFQLIKIPKRLREYIFFENILFPEETS